MPAVGMIIAACVQSLNKGAEMSVVGVGEFG